MVFRKPTNKNTSNSFRLGSSHKKISLKVSHRRGRSEETKRQKGQKKSRR